MINPRDTDTRKRLEEEKERLYKRIRDIDARLNAAAPISRLPPELLSRIFIDVRDNCLQDLFGSIRLSHVCHWWRHVALGTPTLWSRITVTEKDNVEQTKVFLERSKASPLTVNVRAPAVNMARAVFQEGYRIQDLNIFTFEMTYGDLGDTMPVLKTIFLDAIRDEDDLLDIPGPFNTCQYPALTDLYLRQCKISPSSTLWAGTLTKLNLHYCTMSLGGLFTILERTPLLQDLALGDVIDPSDSEPTPRSDFIGLLQLKSLALLVFGDISVLIRLLDRLRISVPCRLDIAMSGGAPVSVHEARAFWGLRVFSELWVGTMKKFRSCFIHFNWGPGVALAFEHDLHDRMIVGNVLFQIAIHPNMMQPKDFFREFFRRYSVANVEFLSVDNSRGWYPYRHPAYLGLVFSALPNIKTLELIEGPSLPTFATPAIKDILYCLDPSNGPNVKVTVPGGDPSTTFIARYLDKIILEGRLCTEKGAQYWHAEGEIKTLIEVLNRRKEYRVPISCLHLKRSGVTNEELEELRSIVPDVQDEQLIGLPW